MRDYVAVFVFFLFDAVFPLERAIAAQGNGAHRKQFARLFIFLFKKRGTEPDGKFVDLKVKYLSRKIVSEFVHGDHDKQDKHRKRDRTDRAEYVRRRQ